jgi:nitroimidazol reductase NimA-like FMN-containing flavoprotein (pyridoxamine 5'-phosphate oxidase superfamily)
MSTELKQTIAEYIGKTRVSALATVRADGSPVIRAIGGFAPDGLEIYFSTAKASAKAAQIAGDAPVSFYFQHDNQEIPVFKYVSLIGQARELNVGPERQKAIGILSARSPRFKARAEKGELQDSVIYRVSPSEIKYLDFSKGQGPESTQVLKL